MSRKGAMSAKEVRILNEDDLSNFIIGSAINVHRILGPGLLESVYEKALAYELENKGLKIEVQKSIEIRYEGIILKEGFRADIVVDNKVIIELKSVKTLEPVHFKQILTYLKLSNIKLGLLLNFNVELMRNGIKRVVNKL